MVQVPDVKLKVRPVAHDMLEAVGLTYEDVGPSESDPGTGGEKGVISVIMVRTYDPAGDVPPGTKITLNLFWGIINDPHGVLSKQ